MWLISSFNLILYIEDIDELNFNLSITLGLTLTAGDMSYCFADCNDGIVNLAPGGENDEDVQPGDFVCDPEKGGLYSADPADPGIILPNSIKEGSMPVGDKTFAILIKHHDGAYRYAREFVQYGSWALNSEPFPKARLSVCCDWCHIGPFPDVFSKTEFVLVVMTFTATTGTMYKNGVKLGEKNCNLLPPVSENPLWIGGYKLAATIKSAAVWNRALSAEEVASIDPTTLACQTAGYKKVTHCSIL